MNNIFKTLNEKNICYAVVVANSTFISSGADSHGKDYAIIANEKDYKILKPYMFYEAEFKHERFMCVIARQMRDVDIMQFKEGIAQFIKVVDNRSGRVYELKDNSFKESYLVEKEARRVKKYRL